VGRFAMVGSFYVRWKVSTEPDQLQAAMSTPRWLMLGYGGMDPHVNSVLRTAAEKWGDELRVVVCNQLPEAEAVPDPKGQSRRSYYLTPDRQETAGRVYDMLKPFPMDYRAFFSGAFTIDCFLYGGEGNRFGRVMLTVDGEYGRHFEAIEKWLHL
jgi:hypothetical protein